MCNCGLCYTGENGRTVVDWSKEYERYIRFGYPDKSTLAEYSLKQGHEVLFDETVILARSTFYGACIGKAALENLAGIKDVQ